MSNFNTKHGDAKNGKTHPLYTAWSNMRYRCSNPKHPQFRYYGGRGISVCKSWGDYLVFKKWSVESGWKKGLSLDRVNNDGGYTPSNCRWATHREQMCNTSQNVFLECDGERRTMSEWSRITGIGYKTIEGRLRCGWAVDDALKRPPASGRKRGPKPHAKKAV